MRFLSLALLICAVAACMAKRGMPYVTDDCVQSIDHNLTISAFTGTIGSEKASTKNRATAFYNRGNAFGHLGRYKRAVADYDQSILLDPGSARTYNNRGFAYEELGQQARAVDDYDQTLQLDPAYEAAYFNRGNALAGLGQFEQAIVDYDQALRLNPRHASFVHNRGVAYESLGQYERAVEDWERAIGIKGATGIRTWQKHLRAHGHYKGPIDANYNDATRAGLMACARDPDC